MFNKTGRWLAWLLFDQALPDGTVPTRRHLTWRTRSVQQEQVDHYWSEPSPGVVPCVETHLFRLDVTRWFAPPITLWRTEVLVQVFAPGLPGWGSDFTPVTNLTRNRSFGSERDARADYVAHQGDIRAALAGESRNPHVR